jgi:hypothetical protein
MKLLNVLLRVYAAVTAYAAALLALLVALLFATGTLTRERLGEAAAVLRSGAPPRPAAPAAPERKPPDGAGAEARAEELRRLETRLAARAGQLEAERRALEAERARLQGPRREDEARAAAEFEANVAILSRLEGAAIAEAMKGWDDATFVRYLRAFRPSKAAEVLEAVRTDPALEADFRRAPPGGPARSERLMGEFRRTP